MGVYFGKLRLGVEVPKHDVWVKSPKGYEVRKYPACVAAEVHVQEGNALRGSDGFRALARYIGAFGTPENEKKAGIKMTAPVVTQNIAMTAPVVTGEGKDGGGYWMQFLMPSQWTMETLPNPTSEKVKLKPIEERYIASTFFSGRCTEESVKAKEEKLLKSLEEDGIKAIGKPELARYNDPFTPGCLRTNEVWVRVKQPSGDASK